MSDRGTLQAIATHLGLAMAPLLDAVSDLQSFQQFMLRMGWEVEDLPPAYTALGAKVKASIDAARALADDPSLDHALAAFDAVKALKQAISALGQAPAGVDASTFLGDMGERLLEVLLVDYLQLELPFLARALELLQVITFETHEPTAGRPGFVETRFRFAEIPRVIADPLSIPTRVYGWGTPDLQFELVAGHLQELLLALDFWVSVGRPSKERGAAFQVARSKTVKPIDTELGISLFETEIAGELVHVGLVLLEMPGEEGHMPGLILQPALPAGLTETIQVRDDLSLAFRAGSDLATTFGIYVRPGEVGVRYPFQPGTAPPTAGFGADLTYKTDGPQLLLGSPAGSRLQLGGITTGVHLDFVGTKAAVELVMAVQGLAAVLSLGDQDSFLGSFFGGKDLTVDVPLGLRWHSENGFAFTGGAGLEVTVAPHRAIGPLTLDTVHLAIVASLPSGGEAPALTAGGDVSLHGKLGPLGFTIEGVGVTLAMRFEEGNAGPFDLDAGFKAPTGLGLVVDTGLVTGGGFLSLDRANGRYAGALQLRIAKIGVSAIGLLDTKLPGGQSGYSFLILISATFPPIQLGYGFTLNGVGGLAGVHRTMAIDALQAGIRNHAVDHVLFPEDPVANANQIISDLRTFFPPAQGRFVFGPMAMIGWGTPTLLTIELGILLELPPPIRLALLGQLSMVLPTADAPLVEIHIDILGTLDVEAKRMAVDAVLRDSRVAAFTLTGSMAFRFSWGDDPVLILAVGGVNPHFQPPAGFPALQPITVSLGLDDNPRISLKGYFALTANTFQVGALAELYAAYGGFNIYGWIGFDALFVFHPFSFIADFSGGVKLSRGSHRLASVQLNATLSGVSPWHAKGEASISLWLFDVSVPFDKRFGDAHAPEAPTVDPQPLLLAAIGDPRNWSGALPPGAWQAVSVAAPSPTEDRVLIDPAGGVTLRQRVLPLNRPLSKFGEATLAGSTRYDVTAVTLGDDPVHWDPVQDQFAPAQFQDLDDAEKLSVPSFAAMDAGVAVQGEALKAGAGLQADLVYETVIIDSPWSTRKAPVYPLPWRQQEVMVAAGAAARAPFLSVGGEKFTRPGRAGAGDKVVVGDEDYVIAGVDDLRPDGALGRPQRKADALAALNQHLAAHPEDIARLQVVPVSEAAADG